VSEPIDAVKEWVQTIREDIEAIKAVVDSAGAEREARRFAAAALNYLVTRMDLVPDHQDAVGIMDDVMVIRVLADLASQHGLGSDLSTADLAAVGRLTNEVDQIEEVIGPDLYAKLRTFCARLEGESVRNRTPDQIVDDPAVRASLYKEVSEDLTRLPPASFKDPDMVVAKFKSYLHHKLKDL
jgi:uncharacterized membrane protein YkvA (DUF1232 family)